MNITNRSCIIVTGAGGYIGSCIGMELLRSSICRNEVCLVGVDNNWSHPWGIPGYDMILPCSYDKIPKSIMKRAKIIVHLGAMSLLGPSVDDPLPYWHNNVGKFSKMLTRLSDSSGYHSEVGIINASSAAVYGDIGMNALIHERSPLNPCNPYGDTKVAVEKLLKAAQKSDVIGRYISLRFFNVMGGVGFSPYGERMAGPGRHMPHVVNRMLNAWSDNTSFKINGTDYQTPDGSCVRDYIHVGYVVHVIERLILDFMGFREDYKDKYWRPDVNAYNICSGVGTSIFELVKMLKDEGIGLKTLGLPRRPGDPTFLVGDPTLTHSVFGKPKSMKDTMKTAIDWQKYKDANIDY